MRSALPFVVLYDTEFILDTNAIDCYHKFDHQPRRGKPRRESRVDRGGTHGFQGRPPTKPLVTTGGFPLLRDVTLLCYGAVKSFGFSGFPCRGRKLPFSLISGAETRKIPGA